MNETTAIKTKRVLINICKYALLIFAAFVALVPIVSCIFTAFKSEEEYANTNVITPPKSWLNFDNFITAWNKANMGEAFLNSFIILICVLAGSIMISAMLLCAEPVQVSRQQADPQPVHHRHPDPRHRLAGHGVPDHDGSASGELHARLHHPDDGHGRYHHLYLPAVLREPFPHAGRKRILDGCTYFGVFFKILLPLLKPAIVTSAILKGVSTYNEYYMANLYLQDKTKYQVVATSLYVFSGPMGNQYNYICAGVIITIIPALIVFLLCQDQIYSGMAAGAVKG